METSLKNFIGEIFLNGIEDSKKKLHIGFLYNELAMDSMGKELQKIRQKKLNLSKLKTKKQIKAIKDYLEKRLIYEGMAIRRLNFLEAFENRRILKGNEVKKYLKAEKPKVLAFTKETGKELDKVKVSMNKYMHKKTKKNN